jgi:hypothetical protein
MAISSNPDTARPARTLTSSATSARTAAHRDSIRARTRRPRGAAGQVRDLWHASLHRHMMVDDQAGRPGLEVHLVAERVGRHIARQRARVLPAVAIADPAHVMPDHPDSHRGKVAYLTGAFDPQVRDAAESAPAAAHRRWHTVWSGQLPSPARAGRPHVSISTPDGKIPIVAEVAVLRCRCHDRDDALRTLAPDRASTGHVWITIWRRHGLNPFRIFWQPIESTASGLVTGGGAARVSPGVSPGLAPPSGRIAQFSHISCGQPPAPMTSPGLG